MPVNGLNVGRDVTLQISGGPNGPVQFSYITSFESRPDVEDRRSVAIDGQVRHAEFHMGWSGSFEIERADSTVDDLWAQLEANYYNNITNPKMSIQETIIEVNGGTTQYQYTEVQLKLADSGKKSGDEFIKQRVDFMATRRFKRA